MKLLKNRTVLGVLCIVVSLLICFAVTPLVNAGLSQKTTIVLFVKDVKAGEEIRKGMLQEVEVGGYNLPENVLRSITATVFKTPRMLLTTSVAKASPSMSSAMMSSGRPDLATCSRIGRRSRMLLIFFSTKRR